MSNGELDPVPLDSLSARAPRTAVLRPREVPLGGLRAMSVWRTLPQAGRTTIGAWCFIDHYGPSETQAVAMSVAPHPHIGLQTISWLFQGEIEHRDSVGSRALVVPGELNLMTAGRGIQHSEVATERSAPLHGVQLWAVLPEAHRDCAPAFKQLATRLEALGPARVRTFLGSFGGSEPVGQLCWDFFGSEITLPAHTEWTAPVSVAHEHGVLVDHGVLGVRCGEGHLTLGPRELGYLEPGAHTLTFETGTEPVRLLLLGGEPFPEPIVMWWNFIGRDSSDIERARDDWQRDVIEGSHPHGRFGHMDGGAAPLPAPALPTVRLKPRTSRPLS